MMKKGRMAFLALLLLIVSAGCAAAPAPGAGTPEGGEAPQTMLVLTVNGTSLNVTWENSETVAALMEELQDGPITIITHRYGGFEQVGSLPGPLPSDDVQITAAPGDVVLYNDDSLVLFFGTNRWAYTRLGHIDGMDEDALKELLGGETAEVMLALQESVE